MSKGISHKGIIESLTANGALVRIVQSSACSGCKIASTCSSSESKEKLVEVAHVDAARYKVGDEVNVIAAESVGFKAVLYAFIIPSVILIAAVFLESWRGHSEIIAALAGLGALLPYYLILYFLRGYFSKIITFYIDQY